MKFWIAEFGTPDGFNFVAAQMTKEMVDAAFAAGLQKSACFL